MVIATAGDDGVKTWSWRGEQLYEKDAFLEETGSRCVRFNHNGQVLVSAGDGGVITLRHASGQKLGQLKEKIDTKYSEDTGRNFMHQSTWNKINAVSFSSGSRYLACGGTDKVVKIWDLKKRSVIRHFRTHTSEVQCVEFSRDGDKFIGSGSANGEISLFNVVTGKVALNLSPAKLMDLEAGASTTSISFSSIDRTGMISSSADGSVYFWDITESQSRALRECYGSLHSAPVADVLFSPVSPHVFASGGYDKRLIVTDTNSDGMAVSEIEVRAPITCMAYLPGGQQISVGTSDGSLLVYDTRRMGSGARAIPLTDVDVHAPVQVSCIQAQPATAMMNPSRQARQEPPPHGKPATPARRVVTPQRRKTPANDEGPAAGAGQAHGGDLPKEEEVNSMLRTKHVALLSPAQSVEKVRMEALTRRQKKKAVEEAVAERVPEPKRAPAPAKAETKATKADSTKPKDVGTRGPGQTVSSLPAPRAEREARARGQDAGREARNAAPLASPDTSVWPRQPSATAPDAFATAPGVEKSEIKQMLEEALDDVKVSVQGSIRDLHVEILRQFQMQMNDMQAMLHDNASKIETLAKENQELRKENLLLRNIY